MDKLTASSFVAEFLPRVKAAERLVAEGLADSSLPQLVNGEASYDVDKFVRAANELAPLAEFSRTTGEQLMVQRAFTGDRVGDGFVAAALTLNERPTWAENALRAAATAGLNVQPTKMREKAERALELLVDARRGLPTSIANFERAAAHGV